MTWAAFFKSRPIAYGSLAGLVGITAGTTISTLIASHIQSYCADAINMLTPIADNVTISELSTIVHIQNHSKTITRDDVNIVLPSDWVDTVNQVINHADKLPDYCFYLSLTMGLCLVMAMSLALASTVAVAVHISDEQSKKEGVNSKPSFHKAPSFHRGHSFDYISIPPEVPGILSALE